MDNPDQVLSPEERIIAEAKKRFSACEQWEALARVNFDYDYKFANGDSTNNYQWDTWVMADRQDRPCLTINKTQQHNLQIINDGKQNKPGVSIRPVGENVSYDAAQIYMEIVRHIEYVSNAENAYDHASEFQVEAGWGCWRVTTDYVDDRSFDQEIYIKRIKDPRSVYIDPDCNEVDNSDARFAFVFSDVPRDLYEAEYPEHADVGGSAVFSNTGDGWFGPDHVRVCEYFKASDKKDKFVWFVLAETQEEIESFWSELEPEGKEIFKAIKEAEKEIPVQLRTYKERDVVRKEIHWYKIAGNVIIDDRPWPGKYIPIIKIVGKETIIDGQLDIKGHTRALLDPQRIYNINASANVEYGALQTKSPLTAPVEAIEGLDEYYRTANVNNAAILPYNQYNEEGRKLDAPQRLNPPVSSPAYVQAMQIAQNEMMMVTGQYQAQMGENENAKSGIAIQQRQRQGDRATFHFLDNQSIGIRYTGKILIDLIPKIYDTKRVFEIEASDGSLMEITLDPNADEALTKLPNENEDVTAQQRIRYIFNPNVGKYAVQSDIGPNFATRRQEAFNALTQIAAQNKEFMNVAGDILWKVADFPEAQVLAQRWRRIIPPNILGDAPNPQQEQIMQQAAQQIEQQLAQIAKLEQEAADRAREFELKEKELQFRASDRMLDNLRADYKAINDRITALGNSGPGISQEQIAPLIRQAIIEASRQGGPDGDNLAPQDVAALPAIGEGGTPVEPEEAEEPAEAEASPAREDMDIGELEYE